jgi:uncharacterized protein YndB with AHSA1/START domain
MTRKHVHEEIFRASPEQLFAILHTPSAIREWWGAARAIVVPEPGGIWIAAWGTDENRPDYVTAATMHVFAPPNRIVFDNYQYHARNGALPFDADFVTEFLVEPRGDQTMLRVTQDGFPDEAIADDFYAGCEIGWRETFKGIRRFLEPYA